MSQDHFDALETADPAFREAALVAALQRLLLHAQTHTAYGRDVLGGFDAASLTNRAALAKLPVLRKADLAVRQKNARTHTPPELLGGLSAVGWGGWELRATRVFQSPGPVYEPEGPGPDPWRMARAMYAAGFRAGDLVHNSFSYHLTPAGAMAESGALALGCTVLPAGVGNTELQLQAAQDLRCSAYAGTPSFLRIMLERAAAAGAPLHIHKAVLSGEAFPPALRDWCLAQGVHAYQSYATADLGLIAYETAARDGLVVDEGVIVEIVRPGTGEPLPPGEVGEVVVTSLNPAYPLIRLGTGDLSAELPHTASACGRTNRRLRGWLGRADQSAKVRGMFIHAAQVGQVRQLVPGLEGAMRWVVEGDGLTSDRFTVQLQQAPTEGLGERVAQAVRDVTKLRADVEFGVTPPNDGQVIEDRRTGTQGSGK